MLYYVASDYHFFHKNIIKYSERPFKNVEEMNAELVKRWNETVTNSDVVYYLGDFAMGKFGMSKDNTLKDMVSSLNGYKKILFLGNHDNSQGKMYEYGWDVVLDQAVVNTVYGRVLLRHYPLLSQHRSSYKMQNILCCIHGHIHVGPDDEYNINASCEMTDYRPILIESIIKRWKNGKGKCL